MNIKLEQLHVFLTVVKYHSFSAASIRLGISKVAVSKTISTLEKELGCTLFNRTTRKLNITEQGINLEQHANNILAASAELTDAFTRYQAQPQGTLRIMSTAYFGEKYLIPNIHKFQTLYPELQLELIFEERFPHLEKEQIDIFIGASMPGYDGLVRKQFTQTRYIMCASKSYLKQHGTPQKPEDLFNHHYITHSMRQPDNVLSFDGHPDITLNPTLRINDANGLMQCALNNLGIIKIHDYKVKEALASQQLIEILSQYHKKTWPVYLFYTHKKYTPKKTRVMLDFLEGILEH
tara:strand:+ start:195186 stop:196064 length:879 start_codon:yes stop_codon:yes gene_type:complete